LGTYFLPTGNVTSINAPNNKTLHATITDNFK
jgi:hypothetical protein